MSYSKVYKSNRVARYHPEWRPYGSPKPAPKYQVVRGYPDSGACPRRIALVGEGPGEDEDQAGYPFVGRSGEELDRFLDAYCIDPDECYITNIGRIYRVGNPDPLPEDIATWEPLLREELNVARPLWIAAIGRISTRYFLGDVDMEAVHGIPFMVRLAWLDNGRDGLVVVVPIVHPAAGFHSTEAQALTAYDFAQLDATLRGRITPRQPDLADRFPVPDYRDLGDSNPDLVTIRESLAGGTKAEPLAVAIDTEGLPGNPWGLSYSVQPGQAFVIRKVHSTAMQVFHMHLIAGINAGRLHVVLHNSLHDLRVLRELGIPIPDGSFTDTMVLAYHLCIEPQGLKALAFRHAGMEMESYDEQVSDAQDRIAVEYYEMLEAMTASGVTYATPASTEYEFFIHDKTNRMRFTTRGEAEFVRASFKASKIRVGQICELEVDPTNPTGVGPFRYIEPYTILERDKETKQLRERIKQPQQIDTRIQRALADLRDGKITAANIRKRWNDTDDIIVDAVEEVVGEMREANLDDVPLGRAVRYAARDADATLRIYPILRERHSALGLERVGAIDHAIIPMVDRMQAVGLVVDIPYLKALSADLSRRMIAKQQEIKDQFGVWINPNSGDQVADILFRPVEEGGYGLQATKQTKGTVDKVTGEIKKRRGSTQDKVLEGLRQAHPIIPLILDYRGLSKAKTSFCDVAIRKAVWEDGQWVIHCLFRITRVSSGRLSATQPNLMAVVGGLLGIEIRNGYIAGEGYEFVEWDLSQIEMRVMASEANDEFLISMLLADEDIHTGTADKMFGYNLTRPYSKEQVAHIRLPSGAKPREPAKRTGFGVITGIQGPGLVDQMRLQGILIETSEAEKWITDWLAACPSVPVYMRQCHSEARQFGYVRDWAGRIRYLPGIHSPFRYVRAEAGRQSHSHKIQGGAQEIMKIAMATIDREVLPYWREQGKYVEPVLQVHDALMFRRKGFNDLEKRDMDAQVRAALFSAAPLGFKVPLDAGTVSATKWGEMEH